MDKELGKIVHYFDKIKVAVIKAKKPFKVGVKIKVKSKVKDFVQTIKSMQLNMKPIKSAAKGKEVAIKVNHEVKKGDLVFKA